MTGFVLTLGSLAVTGENPALSNTGVHSMIRIAIIGAGRIGHVHARAIQGRNDVTLALVCDPFEQNARALAGEYDVRYCLDRTRFSTTPQSTLLSLGLQPSSMSTISSRPSMVANE